MILHPAIVALVLASILIGVMILFSSWFGIRILRFWDMQSGSEEQLALERKTYLISTILSYVFVFQIASLFLFIYTADSLHNLFVGAMCAAGTLYVDPYGYPTFLLKILNCILAGLWLIVNHVDNRAVDYPLIRKKYATLLGMAPFIIAESVLQWLYFSGMKADVITSCCGSLFSAGQTGVGSEITAWPPAFAMATFYGGFVLTLLAGLIYVIRGRTWGYLFSIISGMFFLIACIALISFISLYFYELPTHHCPFCILQKEYSYIGYVLYAALMIGVVSGLGTGILTPAQRNKSLSDELPRFQRKLVLISLIAYLVFVGISIYRMISTDFTMGLL